MKFKFKPGDELKLIDPNSLFGKGQHNDRLKIVNIDYGGKYYEYIIVAGLWASPIAYSLNKDAIERNYTWADKSKRLKEMIDEI